MAFRLALLFLLAVNANAALTLHIQHPFRSDSEKSSYSLHILGSAANNYNPDFSESSQTVMRSEGNDWYYFVWDKEISYFQDWMSFTVKACPNTSDNNYNNNNCVDWKDARRKNLDISRDGAVRRGHRNMDLYVCGRFLPEKFCPPGSKLVWFKSPWGNKALPRMIFGTDSVLMRFAYDDTASCGWFYGAIAPSALQANPSKSAYFERLYASYLTFPKDGVVDLSVALQSADTVFVDGFSER